MFRQLRILALGLLYLLILPLGISANDSVLKFVSEPSLEIELPQTLESKAWSELKCSDLQFHFLSPEERLISQTENEVLMPIPTMKKVIEGFDEEGVVTGFSDQLRDRWWELFNFQHILVFGEDPIHGVLKNFKFRIVFTDFLFKDQTPADERQAKARELVCDWLSDFAKGNQHEYFLQNLLQRTRIEIDLANRVSSDPEIIRAVEQRNGLAFNSSLAPNYPVLIFQNGVAKGGVYDGALSLRFERKRIHKLLSEESLDENILKLTNRSIFETFSQLSIEADGQKLSALEFIQLRAEQLYRAHQETALDPQTLWAEVFLAIYAEFPDFQPELRKALIVLTRNQIDPWLILQMIEVGLRIESDFSIDQRSEFQKFIDEEAVKSLRKFPAAVSFELRKSLSFSLRGRWELKQTQWHELNYQKFQTLHYNYCLVNCGEDYQDSLPRNPRRVQLYAEDRGSRFRDAEEQFIVMINEWYAKESPRSPFQELAVTLDVKAPEMDGRKIQLHSIMKLIYAGIADQTIEHDGVLELEPRLEASLSAFSLYLVNEIVRHTEESIQRQKENERRTPAHLRSEPSSKINIDRVKIDLNKLGAGKIVAEQVDGKFSGPSKFFAGLLETFQQMPKISNEDLLVAPQGQEFWKRDICDPRYYQQENFSFTDLMRCFESKVVVVSVGAPWCLPCKMAAPVSRNVYQALQDAGLVVLNLQVVEENEIASALTHAVFDYGFTSIILSRETQESLGFRSEDVATNRSMVFPAYLYRDHRGQWRHAGIGGTLDLKLIEELLKERDQSFSLEEYISGPETSGK